MDNISQRVFDLMMIGVMNGDGLMSYAIDDCLKIKETIKKEFGLDISASEAYRFWSWRSEKWDATFLTIHSDEEIIRWFKEWQSELEVEQWKEMIESDKVV